MSFGGLVTHFFSARDNMALLGCYLVVDQESLKDELVIQRSDMVGFMIMQKIRLSKLK